MKTITYDPAVYKLVPLEPTNEMSMVELRAHFSAPQSKGMSHYRAVLESVPAELPSVQTHSGKPFAWASWRGGTAKEDQTFANAGICGYEPLPHPLRKALYTHAAPAEVEQLRQQVINAECETARLTLMLRELEAQLAAQPTLVLALPDYEKRRIVVASDEVVDGERLVCVAIKDSQPTPEAIVKAALEAAKKVPRQHALMLADGVFGARYPDEATAICNASTNIGEKIEALDPATIIQAAKEGK